MKIYKIWLEVQHSAEPQLEVLPSDLQLKYFMSVLNCIIRKTLNVMTKCFKIVLYVFKNLQK